MREGLDVDNEGKRNERNIKKEIYDVTYTLRTTNTAPSKRRLFASLNESPMNDVALIRFFLPTVFLFIMKYAIEGSNKSSHQISDVASSLLKNLQSIRDV